VANPLPVSLDWYRSGANWVVGLSTAAIGAGIAFRADLTATATPALVLFVVAGLGFTAAALAGILFYFWLTAFANRAERLDELAKLIEAEKDRDQRAELEKLAATATAVRERSRVKMGKYYRVLMWSFFISVFVGLPAVLLAELPGKPTPPPAARWSVVTMPCPAPCRVARPTVFLVNETSGETWFLDSTRTGAAWRRIPFAAGDTTAPHP